MQVTYLLTKSDRGSIRVLEAVVFVVISPKRRIVTSKCG